MDNVEKAKWTQGVIDGWLSVTFDRDAYIMFRTTAYGVELTLFDLSAQDLAKIAAAAQEGLAKKLDNTIGKK